MLGLVKFLLITCLFRFKRYGNGTLTSSKHIMLEILEHGSSTYPPRTYQNAKAADVTIAFAVEFSTAGERLTHKAAGDKYLAIPLSTNAHIAAKTIYKEIRLRNARVLNIAGNGIYTLKKYGYTQERINQYVYDVLKPITTHLQLDRIISGGQTGIDLAGLVAAMGLSIPAVGLLPRGYLQRGLDNVDVFSNAETIFNQIVGYSNALSK